MQNYPSFKDLISGTIYQVSEINSKIRSIIDKEIGFEFIWVVGEVSNFRGNYASGHWYFSLKDKKSQISAVCFKLANQYIKFIPENGTEVICCGQIGIYEKQGTYQLNIRYIEPKGVGAQALALEQLKEKLQAEGLFDPEKKLSLPYLSQRIGVVTSPTGAAIKDIIKVIGRRFSNTEIIVSPTRVQGESAPQEIVKALDVLYKIDALDLIILARGGGSTEDLWVFNEETVARKISTSPVPIISGVGHEIDITISDLVADIRAATPSIAAELAVKEKKELIKELNNLKQRFNLSLNNRVEILENQLQQFATKVEWIINSKVEKVSNELATLAGKLDSLSPLKILDRGYSIAYEYNTKEVIKSSEKLEKGDEILIKFKIGKAKCTVDKTET